MFVNLSGLARLVCSQIIATGDAMTEGSNLKEKYMWDLEANYMLHMDESLTDYYILNKAVVIIKRKL